MILCYQTKDTPVLKPTLEPPLGSSSPLEPLGPFPPCTLGGEGRFATRVRRFAAALGNL